VTIFSSSSRSSLIREESASMMIFDLANLSRKSPVLDLDIRRSSITFYFEPSGRV
jgi:hypothetical protein